jgi:hypothetical protein
MLVPTDLRINLGEAFFSSLFLEGAGGVGGGGGGGCSIGFRAVGGSSLARPTAGSVPGTDSD